MRDSMLAELLTRLEQFAVSRDPSLLTGPSVLTLTTYLHDAMPYPRTDLEVAYAAGLMYWHRYLALGSNDDLEEALRLLEPTYRAEQAALLGPMRQYLDSKGLAPVDLKVIADRITDLTQAAVSTGDRPGLDRDIDLMRHVVLSASVDHPYRPRWLSNLGAALNVRFQWIGVSADLDEAISVGRESVESVPSGHPERAAYLANLGAFLGTRFELTGQPADFDEVIVVTTEALGSVSDGHPDRARWLSNLGGALQGRFRLTGLSADLDAAVSVGRESVAAASADNPGRAAFLSNLAAALSTRFERTGMFADLEEALAACRNAVMAVPVGDPDRSRMQTRLAGVFLTRFERTGVLADLNEAISTAREAAKSSHEWGADRGMRLSNLGTLLGMRFERTGIQSDLDEAVTAFTNAVSTALAGSSEQARGLSNLGEVLRIRFEQTGVLADLEEAIRVCREALAIGPNDLSGRARWLSNLGTALRARFERTGAMADLYEAVAAGRGAVEAAPIEDRDRAVWLSNFGAALLTRFERTGAMADLDDAVEAFRGAASTIPVGHRIRAAVVSNLGLALLDRFERTNARTDLEEAITACQDALATSPADLPGRAQWLAILSAALRARSELMDVPTDLEEAVMASREALAAVPADNPDRTAILTNLGLTLRSRHRRTGKAADLDEAITAEREAATTVPADHPARAVLLSNLCGSLRARYAKSGTLADIDEAIAVARQAARIKAASPRARAVAAQGWGLAAGDCERWSEAAAGLEEAVTLMGQVAPRSLARRDQELLLGDLNGLASDAAACCVRAGLTDRAIELFEQGRGVLLGQALDTRTDLAEVARRHPSLAERFTALRDELGRDEWAGGRMTALLTGAHMSQGSSAKAERRREAADAFDRVISEIRAKPGLANFLGPLPARDLTAAAANGPIVVVNVSQFGSHALVLTTSGVRAVPLDTLTAGQVERVVAEFRIAFSTWSDIGARRMKGVLGWLWDAVCGPVLDDLGMDRRPAHGSWPRVWWCVSGMLSFLPLHAAGHHHTRSNPVPRTVMDRAVSSYTPTIRALIHARRPPTSSTDSNRQTTSKTRPMVAVAMPDTPGALRLAGAATEARLIKQRFGDQVHMLVGLEATHETVIGALSGARWVHFACHGSTDLHNPSASCLLLTDHKQHPLTVLDVVRLRLEDADLAFLSACATAHAGQRLADEAIHLTSAFQLAGYKHVIGTLWPIDDDSAVEIADAMYEAIAGNWTAENAAAALHAITLRLRNRLVAKPSMWSSHIHCGP